MVRVRGGSKAGQLLRDRLPKWQNQRTARRENHDDDDDGDDSIVVLGDRPGFGTKHLETPGAAAPSPSHVKGKSSATQEASTSKSKPSLEVHIAKGASKRRKRREASVIPESDHEDVTPTQSRPHPTQPVTPRTELPSPSTTQPALRDSSKRCQPKTPVYHRLATPPLPQEPGKRRKRVRSPQPAQPAKRRRHADHASVAETVVGDQRAPANPVDLEDEIELIQVDVCAAADMDEDEDRTTVQPEDKDVMADGVAGGAAVDRSEDDDKAALHAELKQLRMRLERLDQEVADRQRVERERDQERTNRELGEVLLDTAEKVIDDTTRELRARITAGNMVTDDLRGMTMKYDKLKEELRGKTSECDKLKGELHGQTVEFDKLEEQFHRNSIRRHELEASLRRKADEFKEFEEEVTRLQEVNARDREMLKRLESLLTSETAQHRQTKNDLDTRTAEFATVKTELQNRVRAAEAHSKGTERERQDLVRRAKDHETKWKSFEVRARQTERDLNKARHDIISLERKAQTLADKVAKASNQCGIEKRRADQLQDELDAAKTRQLETEDQRVSDAARLESEKQRAEELETALNVAKTLQVETEVRRIETAARFEAVKQRADQLQKALDETKAQQVQSKAVQQDNIHGLSKELEEARKKIAAQRTAHEQEQLSLDEELRQRDVMVKDLEQQVERTRHKLTAAAARERQLQEDLEKSRQTESRSLQELRIQLEMRDKVLQDATERETRLRSDMAFYQKRAHDAQHEVSKLITQLKTQKNQLHEREEQLEHSHRLLRELGNASLMKDHELRKKDNRLEQMATELRERVQELVTSPHSCQVLTNQVSVLETQVQVAEGRVQRLESELSLVTTQGQQRKADGIQAGPRFADVELLLSLAQGHMESSQPEQVAVEMSSAYNSLRLERDEALKAREILFKARKETVDGAKARDEAQHAFKIRLTELLRERVQAVEGRDQALKDRDQALEIRDQALIIRDQALKIRDHALNDRDMAMAGERMIRKKLTSENQELAAALAQIAEDYHKLQTIQTLEKGRLAIEHEVQAEVIFAARQKFAVHRKWLCLPRLDPTDHQGWCFWTGLTDAKAQKGLEEELGSSNMVWLRALLSLLREAELITVNWQERATWQNQYILQLLGQGAMGTQIRPHPPTPQPQAAQGPRTRPPQQGQTPRQQHQQPFTHERRPSGQNFFPQGFPQQQQPPGFVPQAFPQPQQSSGQTFVPQGFPQQHYQPPQSPGFQWSGFPAQGSPTPGFSPNVFPAQAFPAQPTPQSPRPPPRDPPSQGSPAQGFPTQGFPTPDHLFQQGFPHAQTLPQAFTQTSPTPPPPFT